MARKPPFPERFTRLVLRYRSAVLIATILVVAFSALGLKPLIDDFALDYRVLFSEKNPQYRAFLAMEGIYGKRDNIMIALAPEDGHVFTQKTLSIIAEMTERAWQTPYSKRVDSVTNFQRTYAVGDDLFVEALAPDPQSLSPSEQADVRRYALAEPYLVDRMVSADADVAAVNIMMNLPSDAGEEQYEAVDFVRSLMAEFEAKAPWIDFYMTGETMMGHTAVEAGMYDARTLFPIMYLLILLVAGIFLRSAWGVVAVTVVILLSTVAAMGFSGLLHIQLSMITGVVPVIILTLAVADSIHVLVSFFQEYQGRVSKSDAIIRALNANHQPVFLTSLTTSIGFLSLNTSEVPPFADMGNMVAIGVGLAWLFSVTTLPALMSYIPFKPVQRREYGLKLMDRLADISIRHRNEFAVGFGLLTLFMGYAVTQNEFNDLFPEMYGTQIEFRRDTDFIRHNLTGVMQIHHSVEAGEPGGIFKSDYLAELDRLTHWYEHQPGVLHVESYTTVQKRLNRTLHGEQALYYRVPDDRQLAAQYHLLYELSVPYGLDLNNTIDIDRSATRLTVTMDNVESKDIVALEARAQAFTNKYLPALNLVEGVGPSVMMGHAAKRNGNAMISGAIIALLAITAILMISLKSIRLGLVSLLPNLTPGLFAFGVWGLVDGDLGIAAAPAVLVALGIVVDDTIHFMSKYLRARRVDGVPSDEAIHYSFRRVGIALGINVTILILGFSVLDLSSLKPNSFLGMATAMSLLFSLAFTYFMLPTLLSFLEREPKHAP